MQRYQAKIEQEKQEESRKQEDNRQRSILVGMRHWGAGVKDGIELNNAQKAELHRRESQNHIVINLKRKDRNMQAQQITCFPYEKIYDSLLRECQRPPKAVYFQRRRVDPLSHEDSQTWEEVGLSKSNMNVTAEIETLKDPLTFRSNPKRWILRIHV